MNAARLTAFSVTALAAIAALTLAWPRLHASYRYLPVDIAIDRYFSSRAIPTDRLPVLMRFARDAISINDHYHYHNGLSLLHLLKALDWNTPALERRDEYLASAHEAGESLQRAPVQPATWLRLANVRWILREEPEQIVSAWKMSIFTGRTHTSLLPQRIEIGLAHREYMEEEGLAMLRDQLLLAWRVQPGTLVEVLSRRDPELLIVRPLLESTHPLALDEMEAWLARLP